MQSTLRPLTLACAATAFVVSGPLTAQTPTLGPATLLTDTAATVGGAYGTQRNAALAVGNGVSLLVFEDDRAGDTDIVGVRIDAYGDAIDAVPFVIDAAGGHQRAPKLAWNGQHWLVVYTSEVDPGSGYFAPQITARRVAATGALPDPTPLPIALDATGLDFAVASDGNGWVVAYAGTSAGTSDLRARRIGAGGNVLDPGGALVQPSPYSILFGIGVAYAGGNYLFTWSDAGRRGRRTTTALAPVDAAAVALPVGGGAPVGNGAEFLFAWTQQTPQFTNEVVARRLAANLAPIDAAPLPLSVAATTPSTASVAATWDGVQWIVAWTQPAVAARAARIDSSGTVLDPGGNVLPDGTTTPQYGPALGALPGGGAALLWHDARHGSADDVYAVPFAGSGTVGAERCLSLGGETLRAGRCAAAGEGFLVTTVAERADGSRVLIWRLDALGRALDAHPLEAAAGSANQLGGAASAWNGSYHLIVWADAGQAAVRARRLDGNGQWLDAVPFAVMPGFAPDVAANGADFLVTGLRYPSYPQFVYSYAARVRGSDGAVLDAPALLVGSSFARRARVVALGANWLVATQAHWSHNQNQGGIDLRLVDAFGTVTTLNGMAVLTMQGGGTVDVASAGTSALVVAQSGSNWTNTEVYAQRVLADGSQPASMTVITGASPNGQSRPAALWTGNEYVVTYETYQNNVWSYDLESDVYGIRFAEDGMQQDASGQPFWDGPAYEQRSDGDGIGDGRALHVASVWDPALAAMRLSVRLQRPAGLSWFGTGTPGCAGEHGIDALGAPTAGNAAFAVRCDRGPAPGVGVLAFGTAGHAAGFDPGLGFLLHLDPTPPNAMVLQLMVADGAGVAVVPVPLTPAANWAGFTMVAQGAFWWPGPCQPSGSGFSSTPGLTITVN